MAWLGVVDTVVIIAILWALWRVVDRIEALEREVEDQRIRLAATASVRDRARRLEAALAAVEAVPPWPPLRKNAYVSQETGRVEPVDSSPPS